MIISIAVRTQTNLYLSKKSLLPSFQVHQDWKTALRLILKIQETLSNTPRLSLLKKLPAKIQLYKTSIKKILLKILK
jgi:hypothetical protein